MIVILTLLYCDTRKYEFDIRKIIITNWTDLVKKLESLSFFFVPSHSYFRRFNHYANKVTQCNRTKKHRDDFIRDYIRKFQDGSMNSSSVFHCENKLFFPFFFLPISEFLRYLLTSSTGVRQKKNHLVKKFV